MACQALHRLAYSYMSAGNGAFRITFRLARPSPSGWRSQDLCQHTIVKVEPRAPRVNIIEIHEILCRSHKNARPKVALPLGYRDSWQISTASVGSQRRNKGDNSALFDALILVNRLISGTACVLPQSVRNTSF